MAEEPGVPCYWPGCPKIVLKGSRYCSDHKTQGARRDDRYRAPAHVRGYDNRWHVYRDFYLRSNPVCVRCQAVATVVDHITPVTGPDDPSFYSVENHQALCSQCHAEKHKEK